MAYLVDTNILVHRVNTTDPQHIPTMAALATLRNRGETVHITPQNLIEFRNVATRPVNRNGLGMTSIAVAIEIARLERLFPLLEDIPTIFPAWKLLAGAAGVMGKQVHDTRLVAVCHAHGVTHLLTFNTTDFMRFQNIGMGLRSSIRPKFDLTAALSRT